MELAWSKPRFNFGRFHELALMAGAIISAEGASAQGVYLDFGNNPGPRYRDYDGPRYRDREGYGIAVNGTGIAGTVDTIGQGNFELLTGVRMAGRCKTVSANHTEATNRLLKSRCRTSPAP
jgi:hypothetical protein